MRVVALPSSDGGLGLRVGDEGLQVCERQVGARSRPAGRRGSRLPCPSPPCHHHAQRVEGDVGAVAVGVGDQPGLQHAVVVAPPVDGVAERIAWC